MVTDYAGNVIQDELHYPWGQEWTMAGTMTEERFASLHHRDSATNLDPTHFRMYSSDQGRWLTPDPAQADIYRPQSMSRYAYAVNNPTALIDPQGLFVYCYYCNLPPDIIQTCSQQAVFAGACYGGSSPAPPNSNLGGDGGGYNGPVIAPAPPKPPPPPSQVQGFNACVAQAKAVEDAQLRSGIAVTAAGGALVLGSFALVPVLAGEGFFEGIEGVANGIHVGPVVVGPFYVYELGVMRMTAAVNQYDASVAQCQDKYGVYPSGG